MVGYDGIEVPNSGCSDEEPADAGPGLMGRIFTTFIHVKEKVGRGHSATGSGRSTPRSVGADEGLHEKTIEQEPHEHSPLLVRHEQQNRDAVGQDSAGAGGLVGDGVETSPVAAPSPTGSSLYGEAGASPRGSAHFPGEATAPSPRLHLKDLGERIWDKLPGSRTDPYSVANPSPRSQSTSPYTESYQPAVSPRGPSVQHSSTPSSPRILGKLKTEGLMTKFADKLHLHEKSSSPRAAAANPGTSATETGTPTATSSSIPSTDTGMPTPTLGGPSTTIGTATGPTEN